LAAVAGFRQQDLDIQLEGTRLTVKGTPEKPETETRWLHQGLTGPVNWRLAAYQNKIKASPCC
jgi:molecular chaperone IbpB